MDWLVLAESVTGTAHRQRQLPCQDACRFRTFGPSAEWLVLAVADGAGSAAHADLGALVACDELTRRAGEGDPAALCTRDAMAALFSDVRMALVAEAERTSSHPRDYACTALLAVLGPATAAFGQVGDGAIVVAHGGEHRAVFWPEPSEYANTTDFLTDDLFAAALRVETTSVPLDEVAVFTDGLQRLALDFSTRAPHPAFFRPLFKALRTAGSPEPLQTPLRQFLDSERVNERTDDDKTLVLAVRRQ